MEGIQGIFPQVCYTEQLSFMDAKATLYQYILRVDLEYPLSTLFGSQLDGG